MGRWGRGQACIQPLWVSFSESPSNIELGARLQIQLTDVRSQAPPTTPWNGSATKTPRTMIHVFIRLDAYTSKAMAELSQTPQALWIRHLQDMRGFRSAPPLQSPRIK